MYDYHYAALRTHPLLPYTRQPGLVRRGRCRHRHVRFFFLHPCCLKSPVERLLPVRCCCSYPGNVSVCCSAGCRHPSLSACVHVVAAAETLLWQNCYPVLGAKLSSNPSGFLVPKTKRGRNLKRVTVSVSLLLRGPVVNRTKYCW